MILKQRVTPYSLSLVVVNSRTALYQIKNIFNKSEEYIGWITVFYGLFWMHFHLLQ